MTYYRDDKIRKYVQGKYDFMSFAENFGSKYGKNFLNKGISASKRIKTVAKKLNESKYGEMLKKEGTKVGKLTGKQLSDKIIPAAVDLAGSKIADKITSLKVSDNQEPQEEIEEEEIIIPPHQRQKIINDVRLF